MEDKQRDKHWHRLPWMGWSKNFGRIASWPRRSVLMIRIWVYIWGSYSFASVLPTKWPQWSSYFWPFHLSSSVLPLCTGPMMLASAQIIRLDDQWSYSLLIFNILRLSLLVMTIFTSWQSGTGVLVTTTRRRSQRPSGTFASGTDAISSSQLGQDKTRQDIFRIELVMVSEIHSYTYTCSPPLE